jgi:hypothetical protein
LNDQSQKLKNPDTYKGSCVIGELPLYLYVIFVLVCGAISFGGGVLVVDSNYVAWRTCGVLLFFLGIAGYASLASTFVYGSPLVIWGLGDAKDCEGEHGKYDGGMFHSESVLALENYTLPVLSDQNTGSNPSHTFCESGQCGFSRSAA